MKPPVLLFALIPALASFGAESEFALGVRTTDPLTPTAEQTHFKLPPGFEIQLVTSEPDINKPMNMAFDATGRLWVTTSIEYPYAAPTNRVGRDRLMIFEDFAPDGRARKVTEFADGLNIPIGVYPFRNDETHWKAIVWSIPNIWLLEDTDGDGKADKREILYGPFDYSRDTHGNQSSFTRGFDGWLYATHGFNNHSIVTGRDGNTVDMQSGNTYRMRLDGERIEHHTHGQVNPFGLTWDERGNLYSSDCHSAPIYQLLFGGYYPSFGKPDDGLGFAPVMMEHAHGSTAIDGALYYTDDLWPEEYRDNFLIGNVMTSRLNRDRIVFNGSTPTAVEQDDFLTTTDPWFRPVHNVLGPDGALYIADFYNRIIGHYEVPLTHPGRDRERGRIWRVVYKDKPLHPVALPNELDGLINELGSPNLTRRLLAMSEIQDRFGTRALKPLNESLSSLRQDRSRNQGDNDRSSELVSILWLMNRIQMMPADSVIAFAQDGDPVVRVHVQRLLAERGRLVSAGLATPPPEGSSEVRKSAIAGLSDPDPLVRRTAAETMSAWPSVENVQPLLNALSKANPADTHLVYVLRKSLRDQLLDEAIFAEIAKQRLLDMDVIAIADVAVAVPSEAAGKFLIQHRNQFVHEGDLPRRALQHAASCAPAAALDELAAAIQTESANDLDFQLTLFQAVREGVERRGLKPSPTLQSWAGVLATRLLESVAGSTDWTNQPLDDTSNPANPWGFQERAQADTGKPARMLSSLVQGEPLTGRLVSKPFTAPKQLSFFLAGHDGYPDKPAQDKNGVHLRDVETGTVIASANPPRNDTAQRITWNLSDNAGKKVRIEVIDGDTATAYAWLAIGRFEPPVVAFPEIAPATVVSRQIAAAELASAAGPLNADAPLKTKLMDLAQNRAADVSARAAAARVVLPEKVALIEVVGNRQVPFVWKTRIIDLVTVASFEEATVFQEKLFKEAPQRVQAPVVSAAIANADDAMYLVSAMESGQVPVSLLNNRELGEKIQTVASAETRARVKRLIASLPDAGADLQKLIDQRREGFDASKASIAKGGELFTQLCAVCHQINGKGALIGPQLTGIGNRGVERLLEDIIDPNRNVDHAFATTTLVMKNGDIESGLFRREQGAVLVLANAGGQEFALPKEDVAERKESIVSLMPANFGEALTAEQMNDLLAFLLEQR